MALMKAMVTEHGIQLPEAYIRIDEILSGDKSSLTIRVRAYADYERCSAGHQWVEEKLHTFPPSVADDAPNYHKQGYEWLKQQPEYAGSVDV